MAEQDDFTPDDFVPDSAAAPPAPPKRQRSGHGPASMARLAMNPFAWAAEQGNDMSSLMAMPGGLVSGPLGAGISGIGGGAGEFFDQAARGEFSPGGIGMEAGKQGLLGLAGAGMAKAGVYVAKQMMQGALRPLLGMTRVDPNVAQHTLEQGATIGRLPVVADIADRLPAGPIKNAANRMAGGWQASRQVRREAAGNTAGMLQRATSGPVARVKFKMSALLPNKADIVSKASPLRDEELTEAHDLIQKIARNYAGPKTPVELKAIKQELQARARSAYEAVAQKGKPFSPDAPDLPVSSRVYWKAAANVQKALEGIPESVAGGSIGKAEKATQKAINVTNAIKRAGDVSSSGVPQWIPQTVGRGGAAATGGAIGALGGGTPQERMQQGAAGMLTGSALTHPAVLSRLAYLLHNPATMNALRQSPRLAEMLFNAGSMPPDTLDER